MSRTDLPNPDLIVIPARFGSKRLPGKPLVPIAGRTLLERVAHVAREASRMAGGIDILVATDDPRIEAHARDLGCEAVMTASGISSTRIGEALDRYEMQAIAGIFHVPAWDSRVIVGFDRDFVFTMIELMFGGDGSEPPIEDMRSFSSLEMQITQALFEQVGHALQAAFSQATEGWPSASSGWRS